MLSRSSLRPQKSGVWATPLSLSATSISYQAFKPLLFSTVILLNHTSNSILNHPLYY